MLTGVEACVHRWHHIVEARVHASRRLGEVVCLMLLVHGIIRVVLRRLLNHLHHAWVLRHLVVRKAAMNKWLLCRVRVALTTTVLVEENAIVLRV